MTAMRKRILEESVLLVSIIKWSLLAACVGAIVSISTFAFLKLLDLSISFTSGIKNYFLLLPAGLFVSSLLVYYFAPEAKGFGTEKVIEAVHKRFGKIKPSVIPIKLMATIITIATGGSAGKIGPCGQIGAGITSALTRLFRFSDTDRRKLVVCGIGAGFASIFGTPITAAIFGVEVLFIGSLFYDYLLPSLVASIVSYHISNLLGVSFFRISLNVVPSFSWILLIQVCGAGLFLGICSYVFIEMLRFFEKLNRKIPVWEPLKGVLGAVPLVMLTFAFSGLYLGLGIDTINLAVNGGDVPPAAFLLKMLFTAVTLTFGGSGGIILPIFFIGATSGSFLNRVFGGDPSVFPAIGMVGLLAGAANTPISACIMALEFFGVSLAPYAAVACVISFLLTGHRSVFRSQQLVISKSYSFKVDQGVAIEEVGKIKFVPRQKTITGFISRLFHRQDRKGS